MCTNSTKDIPDNQKAETSEEVEKYFPGFMAFTDCTEQQIPRTIDKSRRRCIIQAKRKDIL